jgi:uncharacterized repeat protein (TIGR01451 family)
MKYCYTCLVLCFAFFSTFTGASQTYFFNRTIGSPVSFEKPTRIVTDRRGNLYVATERGFRITKFNTKGDRLLVFGQEGDGEGFFTSQIIDIAVDADENIYVADQKGIQKFNAKGEFVRVVSALYDCTAISVDEYKNIYLAVRGTQHQIQKLDPKGKLLLKFVSSGAATGQLQSITAMSVDSKGYIYTAESSSHRIQKFDSTGTFIFTVGTQGSANNQFYYPTGITTDLNGNIYVSDSNNHRIQKFNSSGVFISSIGSFGSKDGQFHFTYGVCVDLAGNIYVADYLNNRVQSFSSKGKMIQKYGLRGTGEGQLTYMYGTRRDRLGNFYISDAGFVVKYNPAGILVKKIGTPGTQNGQFVSPGEMATDAKNNLYVCDRNNGRIQKFDTAGNFLFVFGKNGRGNGEFNIPSGIDIDPWGNIYVTDANNGRVQKFDSTGRYLLQFDKPQSDVFAPKAIVIDSRGNSYVTDTRNSAVYKFDLSGKFLKQIGNAGSDPGSFASPVAIGIDQQENLYIADQKNYRIQILNSEGVFITQFGSQGQEQNQFGSITDLEVSPEGDVYVTDYTNFRIAVFTTRSNEINLIRGKIFIANNTDCIQDSSEIGMPNAIVLAQPGSYYTVTNSEGFYSIQVDTGRYQITQLLSTHSKNKVTTRVCPQNDSVYVVNFSDRNQIRSDINFANKVTLLPYLSSSVSSDRRRRCFLNSTVVSYTNSGYADAANVKVYVKLPKHVIFQSADKAYTIDKDSNYIFAIGSLKANESGTIHITDSVACVANIRGLTACTKVWITPSNNYTLPVDSPWDQSDITLSGKCIENGRVKLVIHNTGKTMADSSAFRIYLDAQLAMQKHFRLTAGDSLVLRVPANGKTVRLEADQREGHPRKAQSNLTIEGCVATASDVVSKGFVDVLPQDDAEPEVSISCLPIIDSYDPNDKLVSPAGTTLDHYTPTGSELKYTIRFQNTGTDTAYTVTILDTLSDKLDIASLQLGAASHKYSFNVSGKGKPVLKWTFNNINLPDSTRDQPGSNGFVQFSIKPKAGLAEKARIENFADIIFDYNDPVRTNTTTNVLYDLPPIVDNSIRLHEKNVIFLKPTITSFTPAQAGFGEQMTIRGTNYQTVATDNIVKINGIRATVVSASETELIVLVPQAVTAGKVSVTTLGGTAVSEVDFVLGSEQPQWSRAIRVYPNPSQGRFTVDLSGSATVINRIEVVNTLGQKIVSQNVSKASPKQEIDLSGHSAGFYLVIFRSSAGNATRKIILR